MPKAEAGSTKHIANKMKAKGLQRLRWYCQICAKQCRDENGFKQHTLSESHVRALSIVGEDPIKYINQYSDQFRRDFLQLLKTSHGEKKVSMNGFYQEYIRDKEHVHMNSTKWPSLTEFAKFLGREGLCRVSEEGERGLEISFVDDSADAIARREGVKKTERMAKGDETLESRLLEQQVKRAREMAKVREREEEGRPKIAMEEIVVEPVKVSLSLAAKAAPQKVEVVAEPSPDAAVAIHTFSTADAAAIPADVAQPLAESADTSATPAPISAAPPKISLGGLAKKSNPLMGGSKKNAHSGKSSAAPMAPAKKMSNAERIMKEELERKRLHDARGGSGAKRQRLG
nr:hypothetical protein B0A51_04865 [Rachicladosporium sp. CCFEE 5018]